MHTMPAIDSRSETATVNPASEAKRVIVSTASQPGELVSAPKAPAAPIRGAVQSCQVNRVRAGASNARKPASNAPVERPPATGESSCRSMRIATPTGRATSRPRRRAGSGASRSSQFPGDERHSQTYAIVAGRSRQTANASRAMAIPITVAMARSSTALTADSPMACDSVTM